MSPRVIIVGAGVAGLACARALEEGGVEVTLLDKGRAVGGRITTRRRDGHAFDLGAQYLTGRDPRFTARVHALQRRGVVARWDGRVAAFEGTSRAPRETEPVERLVGVPGMNALPLALAEGLDVRSSHRVERIEADGSRFQLEVSVAEAGVTLPPVGARPPRDTASREPATLEGSRLGPFDAVVVCAPPSQAGPLVAGVAPSLSARVASVSLVPCFALGLSFEGHGAEVLAALPFDGAFVGRDEEPADSGLSWLARDSSKPGRAPGERWVLHAREDLSRALYDEPEAKVTAALVGELRALGGLGDVAPSFTTLQRWGLARAPRPLTEGAFFERGTRVGVGGDWASGGRIEGAYLSGLGLAEQVLASLG
ncbi:MAG: FAD-dependent oxidoreductase [Deltaproteobacteria bacterium]|nr:FAD-dependent oxidoreductase [Deltaproteobacteria bacterium]